MTQAGPGSAAGRLLAVLIALPMLTGSTIAAENNTAFPDFSGIWWHPSLPGFGPLASGPTAVTNRSRINGVSDYGQLVGDYTNRILQPCPPCAPERASSRAGDAFLVWGFGGPL